ncbi:MAG: hypothetical protein E3J35_00050 [Methanomassiliicoccales archaeon]|nr:MAG: hypothetical protein E3J35_00050 [Methanomassiliicoccales archaeon]
MDTDLSMADASFWGEDAGDYSGWSVAGAGDVNGDGYDDILIGAPYDDDGGASAGQTYLIFYESAPTVPGNLSVALSRDATYLNLTWDASQYWKNLTGYKVYRSDDGIMYHEIASLNPNTLFYNDTDVILGRVYRYAVTATADASVESPMSWPIEVVCDYDTDLDGTGNQWDDDDDGDGVSDTQDTFPLDPAEWMDTDGDGIGDNADTDDDNDGVLDASDAFPRNPNEWVDTDSDGVGDNADTDDDNDGYPDAVEEQAGSNPKDALSVPLDTDGDGVPDILDQDDDNDGYLDAVEILAGSDPKDPLSVPLDTDGDGTIDIYDLDDDNDGVDDSRDTFPLDATEWVDTDGDGIGNSADPDDDNDGIPDISDLYPLDPLNNIGAIIDYINNTVNDIRNRVVDIQLNLDSMNTTLTDLQNDIDYLNQTIPIKIDALSAQLSGVNDSLTSRVSSAETNILNAIAGLNASLSSDIQNLLVDITNEVGGMNASLSDQLTNLLNSMTTDNDALRTWLEIVLGYIDDNLTATNDTLQTQLSNLDASMTNFYNSLQSDLASVLLALQSHDDSTGENHSDIKDMLNDLLAGGIGIAEIEELKTMLINIATNLSATNQSIANDVLNVANNIDSFQVDTSQRLEDINATLEDLSKLDDILGDLAALDQSLQQAEEQLGAIEETSDEGVSRTDMNTILLVVVLILVIISIVMNLVLRRKLAGEPVRPAEEEEEILEEEGESEEE